MIGYNLCILLFLNPNFLTEKGEKQLCSSCVFFFLMLHCFELVVIFTIWSLQEHNCNLACWYVLLNNKKKDRVVPIMSVLGLFAQSLLQLHLNLICGMPSRSFSGSIFFFNKNWEEIISGIHALQNCSFIQENALFHVLWSSLCFKAL